MARSVLRIVSFALIVIIALSAASSCSVKDDNGQNNAEIIEYLRSKSFDTEPVTDGEVYWTVGGSVYHLYRDCPSLSNSDNVRSGSAEQSGKKKVCAVCYKQYASTDMVAEVSGETDPVGSESTVTTDGGIAELVPLETLAPATDDTSEVDRTIPTGSEEESTDAPDTEVVTVYWTAGGSVWHLDRNCSALARSNDVKSGTIEESGKERGCKRCAGGQD